MGNSPPAALIKKTRLWRELWRCDMYGTDVLGHPVLYHRVDLDLNKLFANFSMDEVKMHYARDMDLADMIMTDLSKQLGKPIWKTVTIIDMGHVGMQQLNTQMLKCLRMIMEIPINFYPDVMWRLYIINATRAVHAVYSGIKPFVPVRDPSLSSRMSGALLWSPTHPDFVPAG